MTDKYDLNRNFKIFNDIRFNFIPNYDIKVAAIMDQFTFDSYKYEADLIFINPNNWLDIFEKEKPDLFFCESAYHGIKDSEGTVGPWNRKICVDFENNVDNREILFSILEYCNSNNIPTIFWNKEDPVSFNDMSYNFVDTALHFDYIFTTDENCISKYLEKGHSNVFCLMFASQPKLFNPIQISERSDDVIFAGSWYRKFNDRCEVMEMIFDRLLNEGFNLKIYNRMFQSTFDGFFFPDKYQKFLFDGVHFSSMPEIYKESKFGLNFNTVTASNTMFARRVFELISSNTVVFSNYSKAVHKLFGDKVIFLDKQSTIKKNYESFLEDNLYNVLENHTYSNRFCQILDSIGLDYVSKHDEIIIFYELDKFNDIHNILRHFNSIDYKFKKLMIILPKYLSKYFFKDILSVNHFIYKHELDSFNFEVDDSNYFCIANLDLKSDFVKKALLHFKYLPNDFGVCFKNNFSEKYMFDDTNNIFNVVFNSKNLKTVLNYFNRFNEYNFEVYYI